MNSPGSFDDEMALAKWHELAPLIDRMMERVGTPGEFLVHPGSSLSGDDRASDPYQVSHVVHMCLTAAVDHLHAAKVLVVDSSQVNLAAPATLARGALETLAAAYWVLGPKERDERVARALRWHVKNMWDSNTALKPRGLTRRPLDEMLKRVLAVADRRGLEGKPISGGYTSTDAVKYADEQLTDLTLGVLFPWRIASGLAHGRPWAYLGFSELELHDASAPNVVSVRLTSSLARALYPNLAAFHLMENLLQLFQQRSAGM